MHSGRQLLDPNKEKLVETLPGRLSAGCLVRLHGLQDQSEQNGKKGILLQFIEDTGRWRVKLKDGSGVSVRVENLTVEDSKQPLQRIREPTAKRRALSQPNIAKAGSSMSFWPSS